jgi:hypothetical protein
MTEIIEIFRLTSFLVTVIKYDSEHNAVFKLFDLKFIFIWMESRQRRQFIFVQASFFIVLEIKKPGKFEAGEQKNQNNN